MSENKFLNLKGKKVIILGGAGLLGSEIYKKLYELDAVPVVVDSDKKKIIKLFEEFKQKKKDQHYLVADLSNPLKINKNLKLINKKFKYCSRWINSFYPKTKDWSNNLKKFNIKSWQRNIDMHLNSSCIMANEIAKNLSKNGGGYIANISSIYGIVAPNFENYTNTNMTSPPAYNAIKGGINSFSKYLASCYGSKKVRVNCLIAGGVFNNQSAIFIKRYSEKTSLKRMAKAEEIASAAIFLISDAASYITGSNLIVDGGYTSL